MRLTVFSNHRCALDANGIARTATGSRSYASWARYLEVFDDVHVVARLARHTTGSAQSTGPGVSIAPVPDYHGVVEFARQFAAIRRAIADACRAESAFILQMPGALASEAAWQLQRLRKPYGVELAGDPLDVFAPGVVAHPLRPVLRSVLAARQRRVAHNAAAALYVTEYTLQRAYPCPGFQVAASNVELAPAAIAHEWKHAQPHQRSFRIVTVGSLAQLYKGTDVLLDAVSCCVSRGLDVSVVVVGDGRYRSQLEAQAAALGLAERVTFCGRIAAGAAVRAQLDAADLFVLPSRADALPRALVEAMARGLPCIGSNVGGIPELLHEQDLVPPGDTAALAGRIEMVLTRPQLRDHMAERCLARARTFSQPVLSERRVQFYREVLRRSSTRQPAAASVSR